MGASPGTLVIPHEADVPRIELYEYSPHSLERRDLSGDNLKSYKFDCESSDSESVTWIDLQGFGDKRQLERLSAEFELHPLLMENVVNVPQRPKVEQYGEQLLVIVRMVEIDENNQIKMEQVSLVIGKNYVLTFQEKYGDVFGGVRKRLEKPSGRLRNNGSDYLAYAIIDSIVDAYYPVLDNIGEHMVTLEDSVIENPTDDLLIQLYQLKNHLLNLRRGIWPQREAIRRLSQDEFELISPEVGVYFRSVYQHCVQTSEVSEMYREMASSLMNTYLTSMANRTNDIMKVLTIVATIFTPLTFLVGVYGMNFQHMPELEYWWAYPLIWVAMLFSTFALIFYFKSKGWIFNKSKSKDS